MASTPAVGSGRLASRRTIGRTVGRLATETKAAFKTTELYAYIVTFALIMIAGATIKQKGNVDAFRADKVWLYATILTVGYMISRGLAKSGSRESYWEDSGQNGSRDTDDR
jgi:hypothetical protein